VSRFFGGLFGGGQKADATLAPSKTSESAPANISAPAAPLVSAPVPAAAPAAAPVVGSPVVQQPSNGQQAGQAAVEPEQKTHPPITKATLERRVLVAVQSPQLVEKKMSNESKFAKRFIRIDVTRKEFQWAKKFTDFQSKAYKSVSISRLITEVVQSENIKGPNFSLILNTMADLPKDVWVKSFYHPSPPKSIDVKFPPGEGNVYFEAYMEVLSLMT
jgi:hypothetical protein